MSSDLIINRRRIAFKTLGCKLNQFETESLVSRFHRSGYDIVDFNQKADIYLINTCTVTKQADRKSRQAVTGAHRRNRDAVIVVTGCVVNNRSGWLKDDCPATYQVNNRQKSSIFGLVESHFSGNSPFTGKPAGGVFRFEPAVHTFHTRSFIKIQDGCDNYCTFCIVPHVRGRSVSRPPENILKNLRAVLDSGFREIVLTGVNLEQYAYGNTRFEDLVKMILEQTGDFRIRISSLEADRIGPDFSALFAHPGLAPHLHLCLQSGSDKILRKMKRKYTIRSFMDIVYGFRKRYADFNFTTDIMAGFPGETEEDFRQTCKVIEEARFGHIHVFRYSPREGTPAANMPGQIPDPVKKERSRIIREISGRSKRAYRNSLVGGKQKVLVEKTARGKRARGYGEHYVPVEFPVPGARRNTFYDVRLTGLSGGKDPVLRGERVPDPSAP